MDTKRIAGELVKGAIVLLRNEGGMLPFSHGQKAVFFGRAQLCTYYSGNGSGASRNSEALNILEECEKNGIYPEPGLKAWYEEALAKEAAEASPEIDLLNINMSVNSGIMYEIFGKYHAPEREFEVPKERLDAASKFIDMAILTIGRNSGGEECDRHLNEDYYLTKSEEQLVKQVCTTFENVVLILNINGLIDLAWTKKYECIRSILFLGICGDQGAAALADVLCGKVNPSGKLPVTIAQYYDDYPSAQHFSWNKDNPEEILTYESYGLDARENGSIGFTKSPVTVYWEDIYTGYRYFDTFSREPLFPFGFGLSYTEFDIGHADAVRQKDGLKMSIRVRNIGDTAGREVIQLYLSAVGTKHERAFQELKGFEKTQLLIPGQAEEVSIFMPWEELACYDEEQAAYVIETGTYQLRIGNSSRNTKYLSEIRVETDLMIQSGQNQLALQECNHGKIEFLSQSAGIDKSDIKPVNTDAGAEGLVLTQADIESCTRTEEKETNSQIVNLQEFSTRELAALCVGYGPGTPFSAFSDGKDPETIYDSEGLPLTTNSHPVGFNGYVSPAMTERKIHSVFYKDGPSGIGERSWPSEMLLACAFDRRLWRQFGDAIGYECEQQQVDIWLAPAVNLHRNPLCGRNFEYISEDPYLTGICACEITRGVQENHPVLVCPKHFAVNEQETYRRGSTKLNYDAADSILTERALREVYLKPFEMLVKQAGVACIMTSFNKINGVFAGGNAGLCTYILMEEWGFKGAVVTDWGDMDIVVDGADAVAAGNDIVMPGGPPVIQQILKGYQEGRVTRNQLETAVKHLMNLIAAIQNNQLQESVDEYEES